MTPKHEHYDDDDEVIGEADDTARCSYCEGGMCRECRSPGRERICKGCRADGVMTCAMCRKMFVPHNETEEHAAGTYGTCVSCARRVEAHDAER